MPVRALTFARIGRSDPGCLKAKRMRVPPRATPWASYDRRAGQAPPNGASQMPRSCVATAAALREPCSDLLVGRRCRPKRLSGSRMTPPFPNQPLEVDPMSEGPIAAAPNAPAPPFPPYPPYPPVIVQLSHGHCGCGGGHSAPLAAPPSYAGPPSVGPPAGAPPSYVPPVPAGPGTPVGPGTVTPPPAPGFNPLDPLGSLTGLLGGLFGGRR